jgi:multidrug resistance protein, MATE family
MGLLPDRALTRTALKMSTPAVAGLSSQVVVSVVETAMVGRLENTKVVLAAMSLGLLATWAITSAFSSLATGTHVLAARRYGQKDYKGAGDVLNNALLLALIIGLLLGLPGVLFAYDIINFFAASKEVALAGTGYMQWRFLGLVVFMFVVSYRGFFNGIGHTKIFMYSAIVINVSNIILNYVFIFGAFGMTARGLSGAGLSSAISNGFGCLYFVAATFLPVYRKRYRYYTGLRIRGDVLHQIVKISLPVSFQNILILLGFLVFASITGVIGTTEQAASQVVITALFASFLPCFGFGTGAQTLVGQNMGKGQPELAYRYGIETARLATYFTVALGALFILLPETVISIITNNAEVAAAARPILQIAGAGQIIYAGGIVLAHALQAAGATVYVMWVEVLTHWVVFLPVCYVLGVVLGWGIIGAWMALPLYIFAYSTAIYLKYRSKSWLLMRV